MVEMGWERVRVGLSADVFEAALADGRGLDPQSALELAQAELLAVGQ